MDKNEYRAKLDEINDLVDNQDYQGALKIVDTIDWRRVRSARTLCMIGEIYEANKRYEDSRRLLLLARQRAPIGKTVLYRLVELSIKMGNYDEAADYYKNYVEIAPNDNSRYILKYKLYRAKRAPIEEQIAILQEYKEKEYTERWSFELARLYAKAGMKEECIEVCDDLILWFNEGRYVTKAMELKMRYTDLTPQQKESYERGHSQKISETAAKSVAAVTAASEAAAKVVESVTPEEQEEIEKILSSVEFKVPEEPVKVDTEHLQNKVAQGIREVFQGNKEDAEEETAATMDPEVQKSSENQDYVVKDLEPENLDKTMEFKPFHMGEGMTMQVKAEAPKSKMFDSKDFVPGSIKTSSKEFELDLEALLAETANELAQAVAEEKENTEAEEEAELVPEEPEVVQEAGVAPVALSLSEALEAKADEFDAMTAGMTREIVLEESQEEQEEEIEAQEAVLAEEEAEEVSPEELTVELPEIQEVIVEEEVTEEDATKEFPVDKVKEALEEAHVKRVTASVVTEEAHQDAAFHTAVEGLVRHHLTEEEHRRLFTYFFSIPGMSAQINEALDIAQESACAKTSQAGNIIVTGREGSGKTRLSEGLIKALCKERQMEGAKVAYLSAEKLNEKDPVTVVGKLAGGFLVIENAGKLNADVIENMSKAMEFKTNRLTVILEDLKPGIRLLEEKYPDFMKKFDSKIAIPVFTNDELVSFAKTYAKELGYKIDNMAVLALYTLIGENQNEENPVAVGSVREMMDDAIARASKKGRRVGKKVSKRHLDETGRIMLYEKDFDI